MGREYVQNQFASLGISSDRVELVSWISTTQAHLKLYDRVDIALDTFPYNGTTTTCEALWMGVPVVTFAGTSHVSRVGAALLTHAGLTDWIASDVAGYIDLAIRLAGNLQNMAKVRQTLRDKLQQSPVCDGARLAKQLETIFQQVWAARPGKI
jgi:protein O-GlcNAc transferase